MPPLAIFLLRVLLAVVGGAVGTFGTLWVGLVVGGWWQGPQANTGPDGPPPEIGFVILACLLALTFVPFFAIEGARAGSFLGKLIGHKLGIGARQ